MNLSKGDKVTFLNPKTMKTVHGIVSKGGSRSVKVRQVGDPEHEFTGSPHAFTPAEFDLPEDDPSPSVMDGWEVRGHKPQGMGMESFRWEVSIFRNGKKVLIANEDGDGGPVRITAAKGSPPGPTSTPT